LPEPEIYARLARATGMFPEVPRALHALARRGRHGSLVLATAIAAALHRRAPQSQVVFWMYEALGPRLPAPALTVVWLLCLRNALLRRREVVRVLGPAWRRRGPIAICQALFHRLLAHPEGTDLAALDLATNFEDHVRFPDRRVRLAPAAMLREIARALAAPPAPRDREFPLILSAGLRTRWTANTIHRDPSWRKGKGPHCAVSLHPGDADALGVAAGDSVILRTRRGAVCVPVAIDPALSPGHVSIPNGFGTRYAGQLDGVNLNELTASDDRDPFTGCPHHKAVPCRIERLPAR
jgi:anaerobic selenocysteine-containing dehydrogenase